MLTLAPSSPRVPMLLIVLGGLVLALGAGLQLRGIALPEAFVLLTGAETAFGIMARIGGPFCMLGLGLATIAALVARDDVPAAVAVVETPPVDPRPEVGPARMAEWQRRLAEKAAAPQEVAKPERRGFGGFARNLHKAAIVMVGVALAGILAAAFLAGEGLAPVTASVPEISTPAG